MSAKLRPEDRAAVDLLLDRMSAAVGKGNEKAFYAAASPLIRLRVDRLQKLLHLLDLHEETEPPSGLVARTLKRIEAAAHPHASQSMMHLGDGESPIA